MEQTKNEFKPALYFSDALADLGMDEGDVKFASEYAAALAEEMKRYPDHGSLSLDMDDIACAVMNGISFARRGIM